MKQFSSFLLFCIIIVIAFIVANSHIFEFFGVNPNILIALFSVFIFYRLRIGVLLGFFSFTLIVSYSLYPFWGFEYISVIFGAITMTLFRSRLTGNPVGDTFILSCIGTFVFIIFSWFLSGAHPTILGSLYEVAYNGIFGVALFGVLKPIIKNSPLFK